MPPDQNLSTHGKKTAATSRARVPLLVLRGRLIFWFGLHANITGSTSIQKKGVVVFCSWTSETKMMSTSNRVLSCMLVLAAALVGQSVAFQPSPAVGFR